MPVFQLGDELVFPHPTLAEPDGLLAVGGDLSPERLLLAYANGIFPWYSRKPLLWWSPEPRCILYPEQFRRTKSLKQSFRKHAFELRIDTRFADVITCCSKIERKGEKGTWITRDMIRAYTELHSLGYAHSFEIYTKDKLVGGLYGISLGSAFFGESMFHLVTDASKAALSYLVSFCKKNQFGYIDNQVTNEHLLSLGSTEISRDSYLELLARSNQGQTLRGKWTGYASGL